MNKSGNVVVFACNWDGLSCIEAAAHSGLSYPASVKVVRVSCISRVHLGLILKSFEYGAEGVMLLGCEAGDCHYNIDFADILRENKKTQEVLDLAGLDSTRLKLALIPRGDGQGFVNQIKDLIMQIQRARRIESDSICLT